MLSVKKKKSRSEIKAEIDMQMALSPSVAIQYCRAVIDLFRTGKYTLEDCCRAEGIHLKVFRYWVREDIDVEDYILRGIDIPAGCISDMNIEFKAARDVASVNYISNIKQVARQSLMKKVAGYTSKEVTETRVIDSAAEIINKETGKFIPNPNFGKLIVTARRVKIKEEAPDTNAIVFALTNVDKETFKNRNFSHVEVDDKSDSLSNLTDAELDDKIKELEAKTA